MVIIRSFTSWLPEETTPTQPNHEIATEVHVSPEEVARAIDARLRKLFAQRTPKRRRRRLRNLIRRKLLIAFGLGALLTLIGFVAGALVARHVPFAFQ